MIQTENFYNSAYLTLSAYMLNFFEKKNSENLVRSISIDRIIEMPQPLKGAPLCTIFKSKEGEINFCFKNSVTLENVFINLKKIILCRKGISIHNCIFNIFK